MTAAPPQWHRGQACTCPAKQGLCNLDACLLPWAVKYRKDVQPKWYERIAGFFALIFGGRW